MHAHPSHPSRTRDVPVAVETPELPSWLVGLCGVAAVTSVLFCALLLLSF